MAKNYSFTASFKLPSQATMKLAKGQDAASAAKSFTQGVIAGSKQLEALLPGALNRALELPVWGPFAPKTPYLRKNGEVAQAGYRDIIDTGRLADSLKLKTSFLKTKVNTKIMYTAPHAAITYYGGAIQPYGNQSAATVILPARPWVDAVFGGGPMNGAAMINTNQIYQDAIGRTWDQA